MPDSLFKEPDLQGIQGLSETEAASQLIKHGPNELPSSHPRGKFRLFLNILKEPMILLLVIAGTVYFLLGDKTEAFMLLFSILVVAGITFFQEYKSENALAVLRSLSSPRALVIRQGVQKRIPGREVVPGDWILFNEGDRVPADVKLLWELNLLVDESLLTGESVPVTKTPAPIRETDEAASEMNPSSQVYSGTLVVRGRGLGRVTYTGAQSKIGRIGGSLESIQEEKTRLQKETGRLVKIAAILGGICCLLIFIFYGWRTAHWLEGALAGLAAAMALLPEEFPVVLTIYFAMGARRISRKKVLTRHLSAIENLGSTTALCVDKTGTLTLNQMTLQSLRVPDRGLVLEADKQSSLAEDFHQLVEYAILASHKDPFDPMDRAIRESGEKLLQGTEHLHQHWDLLQEYPLSPELLALSCVWKSPDGAQSLIASKGAPEAVMDLCHLPEIQVSFWIEQVQRMASQGYRVLAVAKAVTTHREAQTKSVLSGSDPLPAHQHDFEFEFLGLVGLADPIRPEVPEAVRACYRAGIRLLMMTGDYPETALHIARQIGLHNADDLLTGKELAEMSESEMAHRLKTVAVIARAMPEQKLRIVRALQSQGEVVAMTGDGVNDGPSLKAADIGVAMGGRGTDVAREAADLVLLDDHFASMIEAIRLGRRVFQNITHAMAYLIAAHIAIAGLALLPVLMGLPLMLLPVHIVFLELIIDPASSLIFEADPTQEDIMAQSPRDPRKNFFSLRKLSGNALQGFTILILNLGFYGFLLHLDLKIEQARALAFVSLVLSNLMLILATRSAGSSLRAILSSKNSFFWGIAGFVLVLLCIIFIFPAITRVFSFELASVGYLVAAVTIGFGSLGVLKSVRSDEKVRAS